jgi:hypothetical protein
MQLKQQPTRARDPIVQVAMLVFGKRVCSEQFGVPTAIRSDIAYRYERLRLAAHETHQEI